MFTEKKRKMFESEIWNFKISYAYEKLHGYFYISQKSVDSPRGQSSPGSLQSGQQPSNASRHIPQVSSLATHLQVATPVHPVRKCVGDKHNKYSQEL